MNTKFFFVRPEGKSPLGRHMTRWDDHFKVNVRKIVYQGVDWIYVTQDDEHCRGFVNSVMNFPVFTKGGGIS